jgi:hypothetical protein
VCLVTLVLAVPARAGDAESEATDARPDPLPPSSVDPVIAWLAAPPPPPDPSAPHHVRPILLGGIGGGGSDLWVGGDFGLRIDMITARAAWRLVSQGGYYEEGWTGRLGVVAFERKWFALHGAIGGGQLTRSSSDRSSASGTVGTFDIGVLLVPRWMLGPAFSLSLEGIAPIGSGPLGGPKVAVYGTVNLVAVFLASLRVWP